MHRPRRAASRQQWTRAFRFLNPHLYVESKIAAEFRVSRPPRLELYSSAIYPTCTENGQRGTSSNVATVIPLSSFAVSLFLKRHTRCDSVSDLAAERHAKASERAMKHARQLRYPISNVILFPCATVNSQSRGASHFCANYTLIAPLYTLIDQRM